MSVLALKKEHLPTGQDTLDYIINLLEYYKKSYAHVKITLIHRVMHKLNVAQTKKYFTATSETSF